MAPERHDGRVIPSAFSCDQIYVSWLEVTAVRQRVVTASLSIMLPEPQMPLIVPAGHDAESVTCHAVLGPLS